MVKERYPADEWNIYCAQASDGANDLGDMARCIDMLDEIILPVCQYFAYIEVGTAYQRKHHLDRLLAADEQAPAFRHAPCLVARRHLSGLPRPVFQHGKGLNGHDGDEEGAQAQGEAALRRCGMEFRHAQDACTTQVEKIGLRDLKLDVYPNQIEVITAEQMLDAYTSTGMPLMYRHWSFGKQFAQESDELPARHALARL